MVKPGRQIALIASHFAQCQALNEIPGLIVCKEVSEDAKCK